MSLTWMNKIPTLKVEVLSSAELFVLHRLAAFAQEDGTQSFPSEGTLAAQTHLDRRTVHTILQSLMDMKLIQRVHLVTVNKHKVWEYQMVYEWAQFEEVKRPDYEMNGKKGRRPSRVTSERITQPLTPIVSAPATPTPPKLEPVLVPLVVGPGEQLTTLQSELTRFQTLLAEGKRKSNFTSIRQGEEGIKNVEQAIAQLMEVGGTNGKYH